MKYKTLQDIPSHIFRNMACTDPATPELCEYLLYLLNENEEHLRYIHLESQEYVKHGGYAKINFARWLTSLRSNLRLKGYL